MGLAEKVCVEQVQAISPRAARVVGPVSKPVSTPVSTPHETFKDANGVWLHVVMLGLVLLGAASGLAIAGVQHDPDDAVFMKLKGGFVAGPGWPKLWILSAMLHKSETMPWALASLGVYTAGVLALMWPERVGIMGVAGIGRLIACLMAVAALVYGLDLTGGSHVGRVLKIEFDELLTWLIFLDMAAMILVNMRIAGIAGRGGYHGLAKLCGGMMTLQVSGVLMLLFALNVAHKGLGLMLAAAGAFAAGGIAVALVGLFLVLRIGWEVLRRRLSASGLGKASDEDWK